MAGLVPAISLLRSAAPTPVEFTGTGSVMMRKKHLALQSNPGSPLRRHSPFPSKTIAFVPEHC
jgi:hypothetical protein